MIEAVSEAARNAAGNESADSPGLAVASLRRSRESMVLSEGMLAVLDQGMVSGARFAATVWIGRTCGADALGEYALAMGVVTVAAVIQESLATTPYAVLAAPLGRRARAARSGGALLMHMALAAAVCVAALGVAMVAALGNASRLAALATALALSAPLVLFGDFARRTAIADCNLRAAALLDGVAAAAQLSLLAGLGVFGALDAAAALLAMGVGLALPAIVWLLGTASQRLLQPRLVAQHWSRSVQFGRWILAGQVIGALHGMAPVWILGLSAGVLTAGRFTACQTLALLVNPFLSAMGSFMTPRAALAFAHGGLHGLKTLVTRMLVLMLLVTGSFALSLSLAGDWLLKALFGAEQSSQWLAITLLGACSVGWGASISLGCGLTALRKTQINFRAHLLGAMTTVITIFVLLPWRPLEAAAFGLLMGSAAMSLLQGAALLCELNLPEHAPRRAQGPAARREPLSGAGP